MILFAGLALFALPVAAMAQAVADSSAVASGGSGGSLFDFSSITGIAAVIAIVVTWAAKKWTFVGNSNALKVCCSIVVGIAVCLVAWALGLSSLLAGLPWYMVILNGLYAGIVGTGAYTAYDKVANG